MTNINNQEFLSIRLKHIYLKISQACSRVNRNISDIKILPVTKKRSVEEISHLKNLHFNSFGENHIQEIIQKSKICKNNWIMIGHIQTNKVKQIVKYCSEIQSLDSIKLAKELNKHLLIYGKYINATVQVKTSKEISKYGIDPKDTLNFINEVYHNFPNIKIIGLMTIAENTNNKSVIRSCFKQLRELKDLANKNIPNLNLNKLSMGMSNDFEIAIEEGSTEIRLGSLIFN
ncbi:hypothetical protein CKSOR_00619 [Candidatus Kinetoplastibacterium sorsogonicusi]|uniref:Pyridoxal phosphate homeostasis protein n=1 Tax=Candidatus Kinetoplastidibacterium kentomonadis TaxID=1576550 RepID=A0A3S7JAM4_9PROT|nr:YggS family pyridoxal phosphate-dependent enzyme [Candidatus Kinetoplastibacterium sorsogonicusi]AWD32719.1 hypothetical protein CKSOR_00619 [Candidatus Kinetoplastibacterium sorsogonicusi]